MNRETIEACVSRARAFTAGLKGPFILHLSDTATDMYPLAEALLEAVRPQLAIHTGDMADEYKVGRIPEHLPGYRAALPALLDAMERYADRVICTPGNNDDFSLLENREKIRVVANGSRILEYGVRMELDHIAIPATWGVDFALYGHGPTDDLRYPLPDESDAPIYLNGNYFWTIIDAPTKRFLRVPCRPADRCMRILIARHGHVAYSTYTGQVNDPCRADIPLSPLGMRQARYLAMEVRRLRFDGQILCSPFTRTLMTAQPVAWATGHSIHLAHRFREIVKDSASLEGFQGKTLSEIRREFPEVAENAILPWPWWDPRAETQEDVIARVSPLIDELLARGEDVMLIGHGASTSAAVHCLMEKSGLAFNSYMPMPTSGNCTLSEFRLANGKLRPIRVFSAAHLPITMASASKMMALNRKEPV